MERKITKKYTNGEVTVVWKPDVCIHSAICFNGLPQVFNPRERPWIKPEAANTQEIINQVSKCPSGALTYLMNNETTDQTTIEYETIIEPSENGPLMVYGNVMVKYGDGRTENKSKATAFCRCGASANKPYCDGTHRKIGFKS
jgi:uncharacterized Fe-S cluster protein YjdI